MTDKIREIVARAINEGVADDERTGVIAFAVLSALDAAGYVVVNLPGDWRGWAYEHDCCCHRCKAIRSAADPANPPAGRRDLMTESTRERMARAVYERDVPARVRERPWSRQSDECRDMYRGFVDAILDVLENPSEAVVKDGNDAIWAGESGRVTWRVMFTAIREGK